MKKLVLLLLGLMLLMSYGWVIAEEKGKFGLGVILGEPTGICLKMWTSESTAIDGVMAWSFSENGYFQVHSDYLWHNFTLIKIKKVKLPIYYGPGARIRIGNDTKMGIRGVLGIEYIFSEVPLDVFLEVVPIIEVFPSTGFNLNASIGARYFF